MRFVPYEAAQLGNRLASFDTLAILFYSGNFAFSPDVFSLSLFPKKNNNRVTVFSYRDKFAPIIAPLPTFVMRCVFPFKLERAADGGCYVRISLAPAKLSGNWAVANPAKKIKNSPGNPQFHSPHD